MLLAHGLGGGSGPEIELLAVAVAMIVFAVLVDIQKRMKLIAGGIGVAALLGAFFFNPGGTAQAPSDVAISITNPVDNEVVPANKELAVEVDLDNAELTNETEGTDPRLGHIHIYVDGSVVSMPTTLDTKIELEPGKHTLMAEFVAADHSRFDPPITHEVDVVAE